MSDTSENLHAQSDDPESDTKLPPKVFDRSLPLLALFLLIGLVVLIAALLTVYSNKADPKRDMALSVRSLSNNPGSIRSKLVLTHWLNEGYFHYIGLTVRSPPDKVEIYRSTTGGYMVSAFILEKVFVTVSGRYSWTLLAIHNELVALLFSAFAALLAYRVGRRFGLEPVLAFTGGASVLCVVLTFPSNLMLYWEMSPQVYWLLFAILFLLIEERCMDNRRTLPFTILQATAAFLMTYIEFIAGLAFVFVLALVFILLRRASWRRFLLIALAPALAAVALYELQLFVAAKQFPNTALSGSTFLFRSGMDGESLYYGDHLDIAMRRDVARNNWKVNRPYLFRWKWTFVLGVIATMSLIAGYVRRRVPDIAIDALIALTGVWLVYAAVFSQAFVIHPYLYDVMLFTPLAISLFAFAPALAESLTRRSGVFVLIAFLSAFWLTLFQMRLYALQYPMPGAAVGVEAR
jgi:hypothetical protein